MYEFVYFYEIVEIKMCAEIGLKVMLRPAVYICSECDFGGLP